MKITFVNAPEDFYAQNYGAQFAPLWAFYLSSYVPSGWDTELHDCRLDKIEICQKADVFAFSGINQDFGSICRARAFLKKKFPESTFIVGGPITWSFKQENKISSLFDFDHIFILDGEESLPKFLSAFEKNTHRDLGKVIESRRFPISQAKKLDFRLAKKNATSYYGAVVEASRGCPFLCEFCDIRVLPQNNQTNVKSIPLLVSEIDSYYKLGVKYFQLACDNFIGKNGWADEFLDALIEWKEKNNAKIYLFTWLTINLHKHPKLMEKMRKAGFSILFVGIETVNSNSLLETAKVQNLVSMADALKIIHSYGFIVTPGLIFGFDSDPDSSFEDTLKFIEKTGLMGADPSFLTALAGTPLYERMKKSGRLIETTGKRGIERTKLSTNVRYLKDHNFLARGFLRFVDGFISPQFQLSRLRTMIALVTKSDNYIPVGKIGYANQWVYLKYQVFNLENIRMMLRRAIFLSRPDRLAVFIKAFFLIRMHARKYPDLNTCFFYWVFSWTNLAIKYQGMTEANFDLHSVSGDFDYGQQLDFAELPEAVMSAMKANGVKAEIQAQFTKKAIQNLVASQAPPL